MLNKENYYFLFNLDKLEKMLGHGFNYHVEWYSNTIPPMNFKAVESMPPQNTNNTNLNTSEFTKDFLSENNINLKIGLKLVSIDKAKVTVLTSVLLTIIKENNKKLKNQLDNSKDAKYIRFIDKLLSN